VSTVIQNNDIKTVWLNKTAYITIIDEANQWGNKETGGVLMGYRANNHEAVITLCVGPGPRAVHKHYAFRPDTEFQEQEISRIYKQSGYTETYLGDWHTHPDSVPYLSWRDKTTFRQICLYKPARLENPLMMVLGTKYNQLKVWSYTYRGFLKRSVITECRIIYY
jgi:integrative and conjugative element protein (TIGR02256 family)